MPGSRRINKGQISPEAVADAKLRNIEFRAEDSEEYKEAVLMAMAQQIISTRGKTGGATKDVPLAPEKKSEHELSPEKKEKLISAIRTRFENPPSHYSKQFIEDRQKTRAIIENAVLTAGDDILWTLNEMENSGGEVDCIGADSQNFYFADCSQESPTGRRGMTYDDAEKKANEFGAEMCDFTFYKRIQGLMTVDNLKTSSWIKTEAGNKNKGCFLCGNRSGDEVRVNLLTLPPPSQFRGWRGIVKIPRKLNKPN